MTKRSLVPLVAFGAFALGSAVIGSQIGSTRAAETPADGSDQRPPAVSGLPEAATISPEGEKTIEQIMREKEDLLSGRRFTYDPAGRRDPFRSLIEDVKKVKGQRPKGIQGMGVGEVDLVGVVKNLGGNIAFFHGSDNKGYFLKTGDELFDARIIAVDPDNGTVTLRQQIDDPRQIKPYRDVVKRLVPLEEESQ